ncbi:MAG: ABC-type branched-subunit amino acid transport system substrate-binding protein [Bradymonadia bacterium]|jgi:ABC-type branched-subunit amino acid transport system substrate-binding protein
MRGCVSVALVAGCTSALDFSVECESNAACESLGADLICVDGQCVSDGLQADRGPQPRDAMVNPTLDARVSDRGDLIAQGCTLIGRPGGDAPTIGAMLPALSGPARAGLEHAVGDINAAAGVGGQQIGVLACPTPIDVDAAVDRARRLADVITVPALITGLGPAKTQRIYTDVARAHGLVMLTATTAEPSRIAVGDDGLLWHIRGSARNEAAAIARLALEDDPAAVTIVHRADAWGEMLTAQAEAVLCAAGLCPPDAVTALSFAPYSDQLGAVAARLDPTQIVLAIGRPDDAVSIISALADVGAARVYAVGGPRWADDLAAIFSLDDQGQTRLPEWRAAARSALLCGSASVGPNRRGPAWAGWVGDFETAWPDIDAQRAAPWVDAVFALTYALVAAESSGGEVAGAQLAAGLTRLGAGPRIRVGRIDWTAGVAGLAGGDIDLEGVSSALQFDVQTGVAQGGVDATWYDGTSVGLLPAGEVINVDGQYAPPVPRPDCGEE